MNEMDTNVTKNDLIRFETRVADAFNSAKIKAPIHLYFGNEDQIIDVFKDIDPLDWVLCSWRSHYQCLLKGVPEEEVFEEIIAGRSISLCFPRYKILSSAIVGGILPIATGIALSIKLKEGENKAHCFLGEMTAETGIAHESIKYSRNFELPIRYIVEDNGLSVCSDTRQTWGTSKLQYEETVNPMVYYYKYRTKYPHAGAGTRVEF